MVLAADKSLADPGIKQRAQFEHRAGRHGSEKGWRIDANTGISQRRADAGAGVAKPLAIKTEIAARVLRWVVDHDQVCQRCFFGQRQGTGEIPVAPDVAVDHEERRVAQQGQGVGNTASGFKGPGRFG